VTLSMGIGDSKKARYRALIEERKACQSCTGLTNPSMCEDGAFDCDAVGEWSRWQGNLDAALMVVGQDWGDVKWFVRAKGHSTDTSKTNTTLLELLDSIGFKLKMPSETHDDGVLFFTNAVLCLKSGGAQGPVLREWFRNCGKRFLRPTIELVKPMTVVCLGERAYRAVLGAWEIKAPRFKDAVISKEPVPLSPGGPWVFPVYHCGALALNMNRNIVEQRDDWRRIGEFLACQIERNPAYADHRLTYEESDGLLNCSRVRIELSSAARVSPGPWTAKAGLRSTAALFP
jgi:uracil-DNA glycosylase